MKRNKFLALCALTGARVRKGFYVLDCGLHIQTTPQPKDFAGGWSAFWSFVHAKGGAAYYFDGSAIKEVKEHAVQRTAINPLPTVEERKRWRTLSTLSKREVETRDGGRKYSAFDDGMNERPSRRRAKNNTPILMP